MNTQKTFPFSMPVNWQSPDEVKNLSDNLTDWLLNTGSLTERLQALTNSFDVILLGQEKQVLDLSEQSFLPEYESQTWQIREVILQGDSNQENVHGKQDWVFARSVLPDALCKAQWANLGNQPLGKRIFNDDKFKRSGFEIGRLTQHPLTGKTFNSDIECWARRSKFTVDSFQLIVAEAFLPDSPAYW